MPWSTRDHTADVYLVSEGSSVPDVISEAARGLIEFVWDGPAPAADSWEAIDVAGEDDADRMAELLTEILVRFDSGGAWPVAVRVEGDDDVLRCRLGTLSREATGRPEGREVKAVSRRDLGISALPDGGYRAVALLDL
jgi:SHS2 domain-containing protein